MTPELDPPVQLAGLPDGLIARAVQRTTRAGDDVRVVLDRRGRTRMTQVDLAATMNTSLASAADRLARVPGLTAADRTFILRATRRNETTLRKRFADRSWAIAVTLARAGIVTLRCGVTDALTLGPLIRWDLVTDVVAEARVYEHARQRAAEDRAERRLDILARLTQPGVVHVTGVRPEAIEALTAALETASGTVATSVLAAVAEDLLAGQRHEGPRAFSAARFAHSKERDDVGRILATHGVPEAIGRAIGIVRPLRLGIAGVDIRLSGQVVPTSAVPGLVLIPLGEASMRLDTAHTRLVILENLQAAETAAAAFNGDVAVVYCEGFPGPFQRAHIARLAEQSTNILVCPDADLGGLNIAAVILDGLSRAARARTDVCDPGAQPHKPQALWPADGSTVRGLAAITHSHLRGLAAACLQRGYRVEQEGTITGGIQEWLAEKAEASGMPGPVADAR
jgi:hypothetical protein